ncbi:MULTISPECIES: recombinase family protein [Bacillaceae]|uniref:Recombinase family protein n=2 Tax=Bacillus cereus group TaxID=86661 RepID=Q9RHG6_BACCE|nr:MULTISPECIES: recombinase family protein [Bacillaceae]EEK75662.1 Resolvase [Bacillus cereus R309803]KXY84983.1 resolvase [Bacillus wiedmannii]CGG57093.1 resolvase [Streptococcus pneumoniae]EKS7864667.1 recombinase family protein [Bacillus cereus]KKC52185.1 resolvase [Bacillus sp. UMTAT18]
MKFGYARVSTQDQSLSLQLDALAHYGVDQTFEEKESGKKKNRPQLDDLLKVLRKGDTVVVYKLDRISRSTKHLIELMEHFEAKGIHFVSIQDKIDTTTAMGRFFFRMLASIAELERDIISERTKDGLTAARARGRNGGRPKVDLKKIELAIKMYESKDYSLSQIKTATGIGATTLYRYLDKKKISGKEL